MLMLCCTTVFFIFLELGYDFGQNVNHIGTRAPEFSLGLLSSMQQKTKTTDYNSSTHSINVSVYNFAYKNGNGFISIAKVHLTKIIIIIFSPW